MTPQRRPSLRARLLAATLATVLAAVGVTLVVAGALVRRSVERAALRVLERDAAQLALRLQVDPTGLPPAALVRLLAARGERAAVFPLPLPPGVPLGPRDREAVVGGEPASGRAHWQGRDLLFAAHPLPGRVALVVRPARLGWGDWRPYVGALAAAGLAGLALASGASPLLARAIARPVGRVAEAARR
ncbi:MAG TPA: hypothetical protein VNO34_04420, partial [Actinomycetota bacterium]|nr:hypothetical protein [Actinomycetota bacterium]